MLAKAVAKEAEANFISTISSDLLSKWYGESDKQVSRLFKRARQITPTVIFIDEIDSLAPQRGGGLGEPAVTERVVNTILSEMDGLEEIADQTDGYRIVRSAHGALRGGDGGHQAICAGKYGRRV